MTDIVVLMAGVFLLSQLFLYVYRRLALRQHWLDVPNERSSHSAPTPGGAGLCLAIVFLLAHVYLMVVDHMSVSIMWQSGLALIMAFTGWLDDRLSLSRRLRAAIYLTCAFVFVNVVATQAAAWQLLLLILFVFAFVNAFNFMDGIDGIAASQSLFFAVAFQLVVGGAVDTDLRLVLLTIATLSATFLLWNWSPAKLFLGDSGSMFFGFLLAGIAVYADQLRTLPIFCSLILLAAFIADSSVTLFMRLLNGERVQDAHRSHLYQLLATRWGSHSRVVLVYAVVNITVLLPIALLSHAHPAWAAILCIVTYAILCAIVWFYRTRLLSSAIEKI